MTFLHDEPFCEGAKHSLSRAAQMTDCDWTPVAQIPCGEIRHTQTGKEHYRVFAPAGRPQRGIIYSSVKETEKYIGYNVSFETFFSALSDCRSIVYSAPDSSLGKTYFNNYGAVCSSMVGYAWDIPLRCPTRLWATLPGVQMIELGNLNDLMLCDALLKASSHIAMITDIERDISGNVCFVTVSEAFTPFCEKRRYSAEAFIRYWIDNGYCVCRYADLSKVNAPEFVLPSDTTEKPTVMPEYGNKSNYRLGETVRFLINGDAWKKVIVTGADRKEFPLPGNEPVYQPEKAGYYSVYCENETGRSQESFFCVTDGAASADKSCIRCGEKVHLSFSAADRVLGFLVNDAGSRTLDLHFNSEREQTDGAADYVCTLPAGQYTICFLAAGEYGRYPLKTIDLTVS